MSGSIDLSVGSVASVAAITGGLTMSSTGSTLLGFIVAIVTGMAAGALNGFLARILGLLKAPGLR